MKVNNKRNARVSSKGQINLIWLLRTMKEKVALERQLSYGISKGRRPLFLELEIRVCGNLLLSLFASTAICLSCIVANFAFIH